MSSNSSSVTLTCKTLDNKEFTITASNMNSIATAYKNAVKNINKYSLPDMINVVFYENFVILCPNHTFYFNKIVPGNGGYRQVEEGGIIVKITVTSTEYPISIVNNNYVVMLGKTEYTPKIIDTEKIYLSKVSFTEFDPKYDLGSVMYYKYNQTNIPAIHEIIKISDIYDNTAYTIVNICNKLAEINNQFSFDVNSGTSFTFHFGITGSTKYLPILFTMKNKYKNMFTKDYLDMYFNYYSNNFDWFYSTFSQEIDFNIPDDKTVNIRRRAYYSYDDFEDEQAVFSPSKTPYKFYCSANDNLPETIVGKSVKIGCPSGYNGYQEYKCDQEGVWKNINNNCQQIACSAADVFPRTIAGNTATKNCPTGYAGSITRKCNESGIWEDEVNSCTLIQEESENNYMIYIIIIAIIIVIIIIIVKIKPKVFSQSKKKTNFK